MKLKSMISIILFAFFGVGILLSLVSLYVIGLYLIPNNEILLIVLYLLFYILLYLFFIWLFFEKIMKHIHKKVTRWLKIEE